ncbi:VOC family protein [Kitasatospora sp. NPDC004615]|uniref:VOC family protein n=1 Tax=unclassified Kitasatospora TaxID=2633591 RepID=UPI00367DF522
MATEGFEAVFVETHNWGRSAKFFQELGYRLEPTSGDGSGVFRNGDGPYLVVVEIPEDRQPGVQLALKVPDPDGFRPDPVVEVVTPFQDTHYGTREMTVRDPDGRVWSLQAPAKN